MRSTWQKILLAGGMVALSSDPSLPDVNTLPPGPFSAALAAQEKRPPKLTAKQVVDALNDALDPVENFLLVATPPGPGCTSEFREFSQLCEQVFQKLENNRPCRGLAIQMKESLSEINCENKKDAYGIPLKKYWPKAGWESLSKEKQKKHILNMYKLGQAVETLHIFAHQEPERKK